MLSYLSRRAAYSMVLMVAVSIFGFIIIQAAPGDFITYYVQKLQLSGHTVSTEEIHLMTVRSGLDQPLYIQHWDWATGFLRGDFGQSRFGRALDRLLQVQVVDRVGRQVEFGIDQQVAGLAMPAFRQGDRFADVGGDVADARHGRARADAQEFVRVVREETVGLRHARGLARITAIRQQSLRCRWQAMIMDRDGAATVQPCACRRRVSSASISTAI